jgi:methylaspartate mutase sigma subunit
MNFFLASLAWPASDASFVAFPEKQIDFPVAEATIIGRNGLKMKFSNHFLRGVPSMQTEQTRKKVLVIGVIGADVHAVGNKILYHAFTEAGFDVVNLGVMVSQEEYISAAIESDADAIVVSSLYGQGELDCRGMREKCDEAGLLGIPLVVGGNIVVGKQKFEDVEKRFHAMGFDRAFPPGTPPETTIDALRELLHMDAAACSEAVPV